MTTKAEAGLRKIHRALISVSDKTGIVDFAQRLKGFGVEIISTGGTAKALREAGIDVLDVSDITGFPEMMDGRVKTLHPKIHGGLLAVRDNPEHVKAMQQHGIEPIDMVVINLYPFEQTVKRAGISTAEAIEQIDIGGPAMIRSAAKNAQDVAVIVRHADYQDILNEMQHNEGAISAETRDLLALTAFAKTASYDAFISLFLTKISATKHDPEMSIGGFAFAIPSSGSSKSLWPREIDSEEFSIETLSELPERAQWTLSRIAKLRYGENPHQIAAVYQTRMRNGVANARLLSGKEMSFNNYVDADAAWQLVCDFNDSACAIIKHTNPAGVAIGRTGEEAYRRALACDPVSAFGGIVAFNRKVDAAAARAVTEIFVEVVIAPDFEDEAVDVLKAKKNLRVLRTGEPVSAKGLEYKQISGGMLVQTRDTHQLKREDLRVVTARTPTEKEIDDLLFAWTVCKHTKSNAIVYAREGQTVGVGAGQMSRVDSVKIGAMRAQLPVEGSVLASDAFFPFRDGIDEAAKHGITAAIQPGGSVRDEEVIAAANEHGLAMVFTGVRHFRH
jgi:phosphoribosylaminoimidazolecarboxamide formyltransferase / IMP cyclohydrolase